MRIVRERVRLDLFWQQWKNRTVGIGLYLVLSAIFLAAFHMRPSKEIIIHTRSVHLRLDRGGEDAALEGFLRLAAPSALSFFFWNLTEELRIPFQSRWHGGIGNGISSQHIWHSLKHFLQGIIYQDKYILGEFRKGWLKLIMDYRGQLNVGTPVWQTGLVFKVLTFSDAPLSVCARISKFKIFSAAENRLEILRGFRPSPTFIASTCTAAAYRDDIISVGKLSS